MKEIKTNKQILIDMIENFEDNDPNLKEIITYVKIKICIYIYFIIKLQRIL